MTRQVGLKFASKTKTKRVYPETQLQKALVHHLLLFAHPNVVWHSIPNGGKMAIRTAVHHKQTGLVAGAADLFFMVKGFGYYMELKAPKGVQSDEQKAFEALVFKAGGVYVLVRDIDVALDYLQAWGVIGHYQRRSRTLTARAA